MESVGVLDLLSVVGTPVTETGLGGRIGCSTVEVGSTGDVGAAVFETKVVLTTGLLFIKDSSGAATDDSSEMHRGSDIYSASKEGERRV